MPTTAISNLWTPAIWIKGADEAARTLPALLSSNAVVQSPLFDNIASGAGTIANVPFFRDLTDTAEGIQVENTAANINNHSSATQLFPILNREVGFGSGALAAAVSGQDVVGDITRQIGLARQKRMQAAIQSCLNGLFAFVSGTAALASVRNSIHTETGNSATAANLWSTAAFNNTAALLGELQGNLTGGTLFVHPIVRAAMLTADANSFERVSRGDFIVETYRGLDVYVSNALSRAGTTNGTVYATYILSPRSIGWGMKPQVSTIDVSSLQYYERPDINDYQVYDRTRYMVGIAGTAFTGTPAGQSLTNTELATASNWALRYGSADRCGAALLTTNG